VLKSEIPKETLFRRQEFARWWVESRPASRALKIEAWDRARIPAGFDDFSDILLKTNNG
jgi:hypothetical protein